MRDPSLNMPASQISIANSDILSTLRLKKPGAMNMLYANRKSAENMISPVVIEGGFLFRSLLPAYTDMITTSTMIEVSAWVNVTTVNKRR